MVIVALDIEGGFNIMLYQKVEWVKGITCYFYSNG